MVEKAKVSKPNVSNGLPTTGIFENAMCVSAAPLLKSISGKCSTLLTITIPVMAQMTTVSQNVPLLDTSACLTGLRVCAAAATIGAEPSPDSLLNSPRAIPKRAAIITDVPTKPPPAACGLKADWHIS